MPPHPCVLVLCEFINKLENLRLLFHLFAEGRKGRKAKGKTRQLKKDVADDTNHKVLLTLYRHLCDFCLIADVSKRLWDRTLVACFALMNQHSFLFCSASSFRFPSFASRSLTEGKQQGQVVQN